MLVSNGLLILTLVPIRGNRLAKRIDTARVAYGVPRGFVSQGLCG